MPLATLIFAACLFVAIHLGISGTRLRDALTARLGEQLYRGAFSLLSAAALVWLIWAYASVRTVAISPFWNARIVAQVLMVLAFGLMVYGLTTPGPTVVGGECLLDREDAIRGIHRITRHPFLWGVALWAATHMVFNPDLVNASFFGAFLIVALAGTRSIDAKRARRFGERWSRYRDATSNPPFLAVIEGRNRIVWTELLDWRLLATLVLYTIVLMAHARLFGAPAA